MNDRVGVACDGFVYVAKGDKSIRGQAEKYGFSCMPWMAKGSEGAVLYKNEVTDPSHPSSATTRCRARSSVGGGS